MARQLYRHYAIGRDLPDGKYERFREIHVFAPADGVDADTALGDEAELVGKHVAHLIHHGIVANAGDLLIEVADGPEQAPAWDAFRPVSEVFRAMVALAVRNRMRNPAAVAKLAAVPPKRATGRIETAPQALEG